MFFRTVSYHHTYRGVEGPVLDGILFTEISVNEVNTPAAENGRGEGVTSTLVCVEYTPEVVEETLVLPRASCRQYGEMVFVMQQKSQ